MFLGILTTGGTEPPSSAGYRRVDLSSITFGISPPRSDNEAFTFINLSEIKFPRATANWGKVIGYATYDDADGSDLRHRIDATAPCSVLKGLAASFGPGKLQFPIWRNG